jgi:hypothetical protein
MMPSRLQNPSGTLAERLETGGLMVGEVARMGHNVLLVALAIFSIGLAIAIL